MPDGFLESLDPTGKEQPIADIIAGAIKRPGALTAKAKVAGTSIDAFARAHQNDPGVTGSESRFYLNVLAKAGRTPAKRMRRNASTAEGTATGRIGENTGLPFPARKGQTSV